MCVSDARLPDMKLFSSGDNWYQCLPGWSYCQYPTPRKLRLLAAPRKLRLLAAPRKLRCWPRRGCACWPRRGSCACWPCREAACWPRHGSCAVGRAAVTFARHAFRFVGFLQALAFQSRPRLRTAGGGGEHRRRRGGGSTRTGALAPRAARRAAKTRSHARAKV